MERLTLVEGNETIEAPHCVASRNQLEDYLIIKVNIYGPEYRKKLSNQLAEDLHGSWQKSPKRYFPEFIIFE